MKKAKRYTYLDTYGTGDRSYSDYVGWCKDNELEPAEEYSEEYWRWIHQEIDDDIECFFENLKYEKGVTSWPCVVTGSLGLWNGRFDIESCKCENLAAAVKKCWDRCDYVRVTGENGVVYVDAIHHDGTNRFEIRPLTELGRERMDAGKSICIGNHWHTAKYEDYLY